jgi:hypothetical protein
MDRFRTTQLTAEPSNSIDPALKTRCRECERRSSIPLNMLTILSFWLTAIRKQSGIRLGVGNHCERPAKHQQRMSIDLRIGFYALVRLHKTMHFDATLIDINLLTLEGGDCRTTLRGPIRNVIRRRHIR